MKKKTTTIAVLVVLAALLFSLNSNASPKNKIDFWEFYATKQTPCYVAENQNGKWFVSFSKPLKPFQKNEFISNSWIGETTYINTTGVKTTFFIVEIEAAGVVFPVAVLSTDVNRILS